MDFIPEVVTTEDTTAEVTTADAETMTDATGISTGTNIVSGVTANFDNRRGLGFRDLYPTRDLYRRATSTRRF